MSVEGDLARLAAMIRSADGRMVVLTGAGVSTESGLPDFRSEDGRGSISDWEQAATAEVARTSPERVWEFTRELVSELGDAEPNETHHVLADWERRGLVSMVATQNIDGLHQAAGSREVVELHGTLREAVCTSCDKRVPMQDALTQLAGSSEGYPVCDCGAALRPAIVLFDEMLPYWEWKQASRLITGGETRLLFCLGSSLLVRPVADLPRYARQAGAQVAIINRGDTGYDNPTLHDVLIRAPLGATMTAIGRLLDSPPMRDRF
jgi:NAD-dependent deacetylase